MWVPKVDRQNGHCRNTAKANFLVGKGCLRAVEWRNHYFTRNRSFRQHDKWGMHETADNAGHPPGSRSQRPISTAHFLNDPLFCSLVSLVWFLLEKTGSFGKRYHTTCCQIFFFYSQLWYSFLLLFWTHVFLILNLAQNASGWSPLLAPPHVWSLGLSASYLISAVMIAISLNFCSVFNSSLWSSQSNDSMLSSEYSLLFFNFSTRSHYIFLVLEGHWCALIIISSWGFSLFFF